MKVLISSMMAALLLLNCKKEILPGKTNSTMVGKQQLVAVFDEQNKSHNLLYNSNGQILAYKAQDATTYYKPGNRQFATQLLKETGVKLSYENAEHNDRGNVSRIIKYAGEKPEADIRFQYDDNGYLIKQIVVPESTQSVQQFIYSYAGGNLKTIREYINDELQSIVEIDYYNDLPNPLDIDFFDIKQVGFINDKQFGHQSRNLVRKIIAHAADGKPIAELNYKTSANKNSMSIELRSDSRKLNKYNLIFQ